MRPLEQAFSLASPRVSPREIALAGKGIPALVAAATVGLLASAAISDGILAWATGMAFILYDAFLLAFVLWKTLPLAGKPAWTAPAPPKNRPSVGVIVAAYNEADALEHTIAALLAQSDPPEEILIADDGSTDDTARVLALAYGFALPDAPVCLQRSPFHPQIVWLRAPHAGKAGTLNRAITHIAADILITVDADTLLAPDAVARMREAFAAQGSLVAATGILTPVCDGSLGGRLMQNFQTFEYVRNFVSRYAWMRAHSLLLVSGAFGAYRRDALLRVGGFDPECLVEDYELIHRLYRHAAEQRLPWQIRVIGTAHARTSAPSSIHSFLRQRRRWFAGFLQTQYWNRDMIGNRRFGTLGTLMLPVKTMDTVQPILGLAATGTLAGLVVAGRLPVATAILAIVANKVLLDLVFHLWCVRLYRRWTGGRATAGYRLAAGVALLEPFSFQILRHLGALLGWHHFLTGRRHWGKQTRHAMS